MEAEITFIKTSWGNDAILDKYLYRYLINNTTGPNNSWVCAVKGCKARLRTAKVTGQLVGEIPTNHTHLSNGALKRKARSMENDVIKRMAPTPGVQLKTIISEISSSIEVSYQKSEQRNLILNHYRCNKT